MSIKNGLWVDRYRPRTLEDYVWVNDGLKHQIEAWISEREIPHVLLSGGPGCGKSSLLDLLMELLEVDPSDIKAENASTNTGIDFVRDLENFATTLPCGNLRYIILNEADRLSPQAQDALKDMIEEYTSNCRWLFTTNRPNKITGPLHSRFAQGFHIESLDKESFITRAATILMKEGIDLNDEKLEILDEYISITYPDMRKCLNVLQKNCRTGELVRSIGSGSGSMTEYMVQAVHLFKTNKIHEARKVICANASENDFEEIFKLLYQNIHWWGKDEETQNKAIIIIANRLRDHALVALPELNMSACLIELSML
jgi:DNA polymerase III delta prime subunit